MFEMKRKEDDAARCPYKLESRYKEIIERGGQNGEIIFYQRFLGDSLVYFDIIICQGGLEHAKKEAF